MVQTAFEDRVLVEEATCKAVVLILKGGGDYHGIGIVEVVWKAATAILNFCFAASITYHDPLHGFRSGCGTGTAYLEVKMLQKVYRGGGQVCGVETKGAQFGIDLLDAHKGYPVVNAGASSSGSGGRDRIRSDREDDREKQVRRQGERFMRTQSGTKPNSGGDILRGLRKCGEGA